jgi:integrase
VPLSKQAVGLLRELHKITGQGRYVFPSSESRNTAATLLSEQGWNPDAMERQLSHSDPNRIRRTYNFARYVPERKRMMQAWADYLDRLLDGAKERLGPALLSNQVGGRIGLALKSCRMRRTSPA